MPEPTPKLFSSRHLCSSTVRSAEIGKTTKVQTLSCEKRMPSTVLPCCSAAVLVLACGILLEHNTRGDVSAGGKAVNH